MNEIPNEENIKKELDDTIVLLKLEIKGFESNIKQVEEMQQKFKSTPSEDSKKVIDDAKKRLDSMGKKCADLQQIINNPDKYISNQIKPKARKFINTLESYFEQQELTSDKTVEGKQNERQKTISTIISCANVVDKKTAFDQIAPGLEDNNSEAAKTLRTYFGDYYRDLAKMRVNSEQFNALHQPGVTTTQYARQRAHAASTERATSEGSAADKNAHSTPPRRPKR